MKHRAIFGLISAFFLLFASQTYAQGISTDGKDFYIGFVNPSFNRVVPAFSASFFRVYLLVGSYQDNTASISYFNSDGTEDTVVKYKIQARKSVQIQLDLSRIKMTDPGDEIKEYRSIHVTTEKPSSVQFFSTGASGCGFYTSIPTTLLGRKYVVASHNDNPEGTLAMLGGRGPSVIDVACGFFEIIGTKNGTTVTITPTTTTQGGKHVGVHTGAGATGNPAPYTVSLNRGQCYMVKSGCLNNTYDITGSIIESDKPVAVISGHENAGFGTVGTRNLEGRDYMIEQIIPVNHWDNKDYISIPFVDSDPYNGDGTGEHYRAIVYDSSGVNVVMDDGSAATVVLPINRYHTKQASDIEKPVSFTSNTKPFLIYQIDQTNQSNKAPYPRPSMSQIIPMSRWKNAYLWFVPSNVDEKLQAYYINIIGPKDNKLFDSIYISKNGQKDVPIRSAGLSTVKQWLTIPGHPELKGVTYKVTPGSYYARAKFPFIIYHYGNRAIDADGDLGDFDNDDNFFSYASSLGYQYTSPDSGNISVTVDTLCNSWKICITDSTSGGGVSSITLLDDPYGDLIIPPSGHGPYDYYNVAFDPKDDPSGTGEIIFSGDNKSECVTLNIQNPGKSGYAPLMIATKGGQTRVLELSFAKSLIAITPDPAQGGNLGLIKVGNVLDTVCIFMNLPSSQRDYLVTDVSLIGKDTTMKILSVTPTLPALIKPGDMLQYVVRFTSVDTAKHYDTARIVTDCSNITIPLMAEGGSGIISANDLDFGYVVPGASRCLDTLRITNIGKLPFVLGRDLLLQDTANFTIDIDNVMYGSQTLSLPITIAAGANVKVKLCYHPKVEGADSTALIWKTDIPNPYTLSVKTFSILRGKSAETRLAWDPDTLTYIADSTKKVVLRAFVHNKSPLSTVIDNIIIRGKDSAEFSIEGMQYIPPILIDSSISVWVDIAFRADMTKPDSIRYADRHAQAIIVNTVDSKNPATLELIGTFKTLSVSGDLPLEAFTLSPNPSSGGDVMLSFGLEKPSKLSFAVYDVLGKEVVSLLISYFEKGKQRVMIPTAKLREGSYILRVSDGVLMKSLSFRVVK